MPANGQWRPMALAVGATVTLTVVFFCVFVGFAVLRTFAQLSGNTDSFTIEKPKSQRRCSSACTPSR